MRTSSRQSFVFLSLAFAAGLAAIGCGDDSRNDDLFADSNGTEVSAGATGSERTNAGAELGQPSGGAPSGNAGAAVTASGSSEVRTGGAAQSGASGSADPSGGAPG